MTFFFFFGDTITVTNFSGKNLVPPQIGLTSYAHDGGVYARAKEHARSQRRYFILMSPVLIRKRAHQIVEHAYHQTAGFFMSQNDHHLGDAINFDYVSSPPPSYSFKNFKW